MNSTNDDRESDNSFQPTDEELAAWNQAMEMMRGIAQERGRGDWSTSHRDILQEMDAKLNKAFDGMYTISDLLDDRKAGRDPQPPGAASAGEVDQAPQGDQRLTHFYATLDKYAGKDKISSADWKEIQAALDDLPEMIVVDHGQIARRLGKRPGYVRNRLRVG